MTAAEFAARLNATASKHGWEGRGPAHEDARASLSISEGRDGRTLVKCHVGCTPESIVAASGLEMRDLFAEPAAPAREIVATYHYTDADGILLYQVVRFAPKDFRQRRPDGAGGWIWNLDGTRRVLYRLPELRAAHAPGKRVFIVEGEPYAHAVEQAGDAATPN